MVSPVRSDYHNHTFRCGHAGGTTREYVVQALERGLTEIAITDHIPLYFLPGEDPLPDFAMTRAELPAYVDEVSSLKSEFSGRIDVLLGLEADYAEGHEPALAALLALYDWDVVLGSVHWVTGDWIDAPGSARRHETEGTEALWREYYRLLAKACQTGLFDVMTHFDLPKKFGHRRPPAAEEAEARAIAAASRSGVAIEVSTAGLRKPVGEIYPGPALLARLIEAAVPVVFSSDSHAPVEVGFAIDASREAARAAGAREQLSFRGRRVERHPIA